MLWSTILYVYYKEVLEINFKFAKKTSNMALWTQKLQKKDDGLTSRGASQTLGAECSF